MVSAAKAKEIAGTHVDQIVGGPDTGYRVTQTTSWGDGSHDVRVNVWRTADEIENPRQYTVEVDTDGNITASGWR